MAKKRSYTKKGKGKGKGKSQKGGFYPSVMHGLMRISPFIMSAAGSQAIRLFQNDKKRMSMRAKSRSRVHSTRRDKRK
jgi:hypothetical protein